MRKLQFLLILMAMMAWGNTNCLAQKKQNISVLYLGGQSDWVNGRSEGMPKKFANEKDFQKSVNQRMAAFSSLLRKYFKTVKTMRAADYRPEMSANYDVTIFDGTPPEIEKGGRVYDDKGNVIDYLRPGYVPDDFPYPAITIGSLGETIGRHIGLKNDWYCLCLDADAHNFRASHPIFNGPFKTKMTLRKKPTPEDAFHYKYYYDGEMPDSLMMWQVQTRGYATDSLFEIGMVARPWGYEDSPDCEYISSGVCLKTLDAVAIGRHGNFMHWGFVASPLYMTNEAKVVFANAVAYIAKFKGTRIVRKYNDRIATREYLKELKELATYDSYKEGFGYRNETKKMQRERYYAALEKKNKGEKLSADEEYYLNNTDEDIDEDYSMADQLRFYQKKGIFEMFGEDEKEIQEYYDHNRDYFYGGGKESYTITLDTDVKGLGFANNDIRLIDRAISLWEQGIQKARAKRILTRYTLCRFNTPQEWRQWFNTYKDRLFFTESGGWLWLVNSTDPSIPGNDYSVLKDVSQPQDSKSKQQEQTSHENPVVASASYDASHKQVVVSLRIHPGYHIYGKVSSKDPYIPTEIKINLTDGWQNDGNLETSPVREFNTSGTTVYEGNALFRQKVRGSGPGTANVIVSWQCCDDHICMPPVEKQFSIQLR